MMKEQKGLIVGKITEKIASSSSSGNVFADLGLPNPEELLAKSNLVLKINSIIEKRHLSQVDAAAILGISQPKVSTLQNGRLRGFSLEKLCHFLTLLGRDVDIVIRPKKKAGAGQLRVSSL